MNALAQWGVILAVILIIIIFGSFFSLKIKTILDDPEWNNIYVGIIIGVLIMWVVSWYGHKDDRPYDWCFHLSEERAEYCTNLYEESIDNQKRFYEKYGDPNEGVENDYNFR